PGRASVGGGAGLRPQRAGVLGVRLRRGVARGSAAAGAREVARLQAAARESPSLLAEQALNKWFPGRQGGGAAPAIILVRSASAEEGGRRPSVIDGRRGEGVANFSARVKTYLGSKRWAPYRLDAAGWYLGLPQVGLKARDGYIKEYFVSERRTIRLRSFLSSPGIPATSTSPRQFWTNLCLPFGSCVLALHR
ncbi:unnamed protein product, partial [Prorocentrum cordatum]